MVQNVWQQERKLLLLLMAAAIMLGGIIVLLLLAPAALAGSQATAEPLATQQFNLGWDVIASGGTTMSSASYTLLSTTGQPVAGPASSSSYELLSGYWQEFEEIVISAIKAYLPIVLKP